MGPSARKFSIYNETLCVVRHYRRGESVCPPPSSKKKKKMHFEKLYFNLYGRNKKNFKHFIIDHLGPLIIAFQSAPKYTRFLVDLNERSLEIAVAGSSKKFVDYFVKRVKYCADELYIDVVYPIDQVYLDHDPTEDYTEQEKTWVRDERKPRLVIPQVSLPEHFTAFTMQLEKTVEKTYLFPYTQGGLSRQFDICKSEPSQGQGFFCKWR